MNFRRTVFAWWPVHIAEFRMRGDHAENWPHPCWVRTGERAWLRRVEVVHNLITGEAFHSEIGANDLSPLFSEVALQHWAMTP